VAVQRLQLANPQPLVQLEYHKYQHLFMEARRLRQCPSGHFWDVTRSPGYCPECRATQIERAYHTFLLRAGRRGGKTRIGALASIEESTVSNTRGWCCAPTYPKLNDYVLPAFFKQMPAAWLEHPKTHWSESELTLSLPNRAMVQFRSLEDPDRGRGPGLHWLWIDEICELALIHWQTIEPTLTDEGGIMFATTTPKGEDWVHENFWEPAERGDPGYWATTFATLDNPHIKAHMVERARLRMTDLMFRQEYLAEIVAFTGAIFGELVPPCIIEGTDEQMREYFPEWPNLDLSRPAISGLDPGADHPFAGVHGVQSPLGLVITGEYLERNKLFSQHAPSIQQMRRGFTTSRIAIDRSQLQARIELQQYGIFAQEAENDVIAGISRISAWMLANNKGNRPRGLVLPRRFCPQLIKQLQAYRWAEANQRKDGQLASREQVYKKNDDLVDALRYMLMLYPHLPALHPVAAVNPRRNLEALPEGVRLEIERERRSRQHDTTDEDGVHADTGSMGMGDFEMTH
jgi:Terminase large subunit, T4likevirus-type, N-terminal